MMQVNCSVVCHVKLGSSTAVLLLLAVITDGATGRLCIRVVVVAAVVAAVVVLVVMVVMTMAAFVCGHRVDGGVRITLRRVRCRDTHSEHAPVLVELHRGARHGRAIAHWEATVNKLCMRERKRERERERERERQRERETGAAHTECFPFGSLTFALSVRVGALLYRGALRA